MTQAVVDAQRSDASMGRGRLNQGEEQSRQAGAERTSVVANDSSERDMTMAVIIAFGEAHGAAGRVHTRNDSGQSGGGMPGKLKKNGKKRAASRAKKRRRK